MSPPLPLFASVASNDDASTLPLQVILLVITGAIAAALVASLLRRRRTPTTTARTDTLMAQTPDAPRVASYSAVDGDIAADDPTGVIDVSGPEPVEETTRHPYHDLDLEGGSAAGDGPPNDKEWIRRELLQRFPQLADYPLSQCRVYVEGLGDGVLERALTFFTLIRDRGQIDSLELSKRLGVPARTLSGGLTGRIARRAIELELAIPYAVQRRSGRTIWADRSGIAGRMVTALADERLRRREVRSGSSRDPR